jgi:hypothetical protein
VELPDDDGGVEVGAGHRGRQHDGVEAGRLHAGLDALYGRTDGQVLPAGVFNVVCGDRDTGRLLVEHPVPAMVSITGSVRAGMEVRGRPRRISSECTWSWGQGAGRRL